MILAAAFAATASALSFQAGAQSYSSDGYNQDPAVQSTPARAKGESQHTAQENAWLEAERQRGSSRTYADIPFPVPPNKPAAIPKPESARTAAENRWLTRERAQEDGNVAPVPYPVPPRKPAATASGTESARTAAENEWLTRERDQEAGNVAPVPYPVPPGF
jgi:hypothetical protein